MMTVSSINIWFVYYIFFQFFKRAMNFFLVASFYRIKECSRFSSDFEFSICMVDKTFYVLNRVISHFWDFHHIFTFITLMVSAD